MTVKLRVENTLRWRWTKDAYGQDVSIGLTLFQEINSKPEFDCRSKNQTLVSYAGQMEPLASG